MSSKIRVKCPSCQITLQVSSESRGKQIACPKCKTTLRLPAAPASSVPASPARAGSPARAASPASPATTKPAAAIPVATPNNPVVSARKPAASAHKIVTKKQSVSSSSPQSESPWDDPNLIPSAPGHMAAPNASATNSWEHQSSPSFTPTTSFGGTGYANIPRAYAKKSRKPDVELNEQESRMQSSGIFLIIIPLIATLLPLFGVQLKRLAGLGNYAPIGGLFLGLIGSGFIVWARRNRSDAFVMGAIGAFCAIFFGLGGFTLLEYRDQQAEVAMDNTASFSQSDNSLPTQPASGIRPPSNQGFGNRGPSSGFRANGPGNSGFGNSGPGNSGAAADFEARRKDAAHFEQPTSITSDLIFIHSYGVSDAMKASSFGGKLPPVQNLVGTEAFSSALYTKNPVKGVCGFALGTGLRLVPIESKGPNWKAAVLTEPGEGLHGIRFAFDGKRIVGFQGLIQSESGEMPQATEWFGRKTDDVKESINPSPGKTGCICYEEGNNLLGFGWVML